MHPQIRYFASKTFYEDKICDDSSVLQRQLPVLIQQMESSNTFPRLSFVDVSDSQESKDETSKANLGEAKCTL